MQIPAFITATNRGYWKFSNPVYVLRKYDTKWQIKISCLRKNTPENW